jgi:hypothetical protein
MQMLHTVFYHQKPLSPDSGLIGGQIRRQDQTGGKGRYAVVFIGAMGATCSMKPRINDTPTQGVIVRGASRRGGYRMRLR